MGTSSSVSKLILLSLTLSRLAAMRNGKTCVGQKAKTLIKCTFVRAHRDTVYGFRATFLLQYGCTTARVSKWALLSTKAEADGER